MNAEQMKSRTKAFALRIIRLVDSLDEKPTSKILAQQLLRSGTSVGANYRSVCRAKSRADFINKLKIVEEECDEILYWMEILMDSGKIKQQKIIDLMEEGRQILAMTVASTKTARASNDTSIRNHKL